IQYHEAIFAGRAAIARVEITIETGQTGGGPATAIEICGAKIVPGSAVPKSAHLCDFGDGATLRSQGRMSVSVPSERCRLTLAQRSWKHPGWTAAETGVNSRIAGCRRCMAEMQVRCWRGCLT